MESKIKTVKLSEIKLNPDNPKINYRQSVFICKTCGDKFKSVKACKTRTPIYCSSKCFGESIKKYKTCQYCGSKFADWTRDKYCSRECRIDASRGVSLSEDHRKALSEGRKNSTKCKGPKLYNWKGGNDTFKKRSKVYQNNRRARLLGGGKLNPIFLNNLWIAHRGLCFYCGQPLIEYRGLEHLTPLSRGGKNQIYNLVYSCKSCNSKKRQKTLEDFAIATGRIWLVDKWEDIFIEAYGKQ